MARLGVERIRGMGGGIRWLGDQSRVRILLTAATLVVVVAAMALTGGLVGRGPEPEPSVVAVLVTEPWVAGQPPGAWAPVLVPARLAGVGVSPEALAGEGVVVARDLPADVLLRSADVTDTATQDPTRLVTPVEAEFRGWPAEGATAGAEAMLVDTTRGCAVHVMTLLGVSDTSVDVAADRRLGAWLEADGPWRVMPAPASEEAVASWRCPTLGGDDLVVPVDVDTTSLAGGPLRAGERLLLVAAGEDAPFCAVHEVELWATRGGARVEVAASRAEAEQLTVTPGAGSWRALRLPADDDARGSWRC